MRSYTFPYRFRKAIDWLFETEEKLESQDVKNGYWFIKTGKLLENVKSLKRLLEDYRVNLSAEKEKNCTLNMFIESRLKRPPNIAYVCKHCTFRGKEYRDFCPGCSKDDSGKTSEEYKVISSTDTDSDK